MSTSIRKPRSKRSELPKCVRRVKKKIGDVIEIPTSKGLAYVQYTHEHQEPPVYGSLVRVLDGFFEKRPSMEEICGLVKNKHRFQIFCPVHHTVNLGDWGLIGNFTIPEKFQEFPIFKNMKYLLKKPKNLQEANWTLWDGEKSWPVGKISLDEQMKYPSKMVCNDTGLIHHIETGVSYEGVLLV